MNALFPDSLADASSILILHEGDNPTSDFYLASRLNTTKIEVEWLRLEALPAPSTLITPIVFYHGSISHRREQAWLIPVFEQVVQQYPDVKFELIGNQKVARLFAHISQVKVYPALSWSDYKAWIQKPGRSIGLAPLLEDEVNAARAATRFYDIQASGAVGIYSTGPVYEPVVIDGVNGYLVKTNQALWVSKIVTLLERSVEIGVGVRSLVKIRKLLLYIN